MINTSQPPGTGENYEFDVSMRRFGQISNPRVYGGTKLHLNLHGKSNYFTYRRKKYKLYSYNSVISGNLTLFFKCTQINGPPL